MDRRAPNSQALRRLKVSVTDGRGRPVAAGGLARWLSAAARGRARGVVSVALVTDAAMRRLNRSFRGVNHATDVLSFPPAPDARRAAPGAPALLGDIAIARGVAARQARAEGHPLGVELRILALHGLLHLLGYHHETDSGQMRQVEERLRRQSRLPGGLIDRASGRTIRR